MLDCQELKRQAAFSLENAPGEPQRLVRLHVGALTAANVLLTVALYLLQSRIDHTGGLGGIGLRSLLSTLQVLLQLLYMILLPFWRVGYVAVALSVARRERTPVQTLYAGFFGFWRVLRLFLLLALAGMAVLLSTSYLSSYLYMLTPWGQELSQVLTQTMEQLGSDPDALAQAVSAHTTPIVILSLVLSVSVFIPVFYRVRLCLFRIMDDQPRPFRAILDSVQLTKGGWLSLLKLDLQFWWFYAAQVLFALLAYGDLFLELAGVDLSWPPAVRYFAPYLLSMLLQLVFLLWQKNRVAVTYAHAYEALRLAKDQPQPPREPAPTPEKPGKLPWDGPYAR